MSNIQAVLFDKRYNTPRTATQWLARNQLQPIKPFHTTDRYIRSRISPPVEPMRMLTLDKKRRVRAVVNVQRRQGGRGMFGRITWRRTSKAHGGVIGSDLAVGAATVGIPLLAFAAKKIYDKIKASRGGNVRMTYGKSSVTPMFR